MKTIARIPHDHCPSCGQNKIVMDEKIGESHCGFELRIDMFGDWRTLSMKIH